LIAGVAMALIIIAVQVGYPSRKGSIFIALFGGFFFAVGTCGLFAMAAISMDLTLEVFTEKIVPTTLTYLMKFANVTLMILVLFIVMDRFQLMLRAREIFYAASNVFFIIFILI
jgi:hypothetical protein